MKKISIISAATCLFISMHAKAADKLKTRDQCIAKCMPQTEMITENQLQLEQNLKKIRARKVGETDQEKLKELELEEADAIDRHLAKHEKVCKAMCSYFPETL